MLGSSGLKSLNKIQSLYQAEHGQPGRRFHMKGKSGHHLCIQVPMGTIFKDINDEVVFEITQKEPMFVAARGGAGGKGNHYYLSNENRKPTQYETGHVGDSFNLLLELKLISDAALVNMLNNFREFLRYIY